MLLEHAVKTGNIVCLKNLLKTASVDCLDEVDQKNRTPLMLAAFKGYHDIIKLLLERGATIYTKDLWGKTALMYATQRGHVAIVQDLINAGADPSDKDNAGKSVAQFVQPGGHYNEIMKILNDRMEAKLIRIASRASSPDNSVVSSRKSRSSSPGSLSRSASRPASSLAYSVSTKYSHKTPFTILKDPLELARRGLLKELSAILPSNGGISSNSLNQGNHLGRTPLMVACLNGKRDTMLAILKGGADLDVRDFAGKTVLFCAITKRDVEAVRALVNKGADVNIRDNRGQTPLIASCMDDEEETVKILLSAGANPSLQDNKGRIAADYASQHIRELILSHSVNSSKRKERAVCSSPVDIAASERSSSPQGSLSSGSKHLSSEHSNFSLLSSQRSLSPFNSNIERSALDYVRKNDKNALALFLNGANEVAVNQQDAKGRTAIMIASILGKMDLIEMLLQSTANIAIKDRLGKTSLFHAVEGGNISIIRKLITAGSDVNEIDNSNRTPLIYACLKGDVSSIGDLLAAGANVHRKDIFGKSCLMYATARGDVSSIQVLIDNKAKIQDMDYEGKSVMDYCMSCWNFEAVKRLLKEELKKQRLRKNRPASSKSGVMSDNIENNQKSV